MGILKVSVVDCAKIIERRHKLRKFESFACFLSISFLPRYVQETGPSGEVQIYPPILCFRNGCMGVL